MKNNGLINFEELHDKYEVSIWDTCALQGYFNKSMKGRGIKDGHIFSERFMKRMQYNEGIFVPETVVNEYFRKKNLTNSEIGLLKFLKENERVLSVSDFPLGPLVESKNRYLKKIAEDYTINVQSTDLRIFAWAIEMQKFYQAPVAIISNDISGMSKLWRRLLYRGDIQKGNLGFFPRRGYDLYGFN